MTASQNVLRGIVFIVFAVMLLAIMDAIGKQLSTRYPIPMLVWARYSVHCLLMLAVLLPTYGRRLWYTTRPRAQTLRALMLFGVTGFALAAFRVLPLTVATSISFLAPLLVGLLAGPLLGEKVGRVQAIALITGLAGVVLIARPGGEVPLMGVLFAGLGALCYTGYQLMTRMLAPHESAVTMLFFTALVGTVVSSLTLPWLWTGIEPGLTDGLLICSLGILGGSGHFLLIHAFRLSPASTLAPFLYVQLVWAGLLDLIIFQHVPDGPTWIGIILIVVAGLSVFIHEKINARARPVPPADKAY